MILTPAVGPAELEAVRVIVQFSSRLRTRGPRKRLPGMYSTDSWHRLSQTSRLGPRSFLNIDTGIVPR